MGAHWEPTPLKMHQVAECATKARGSCMFVLKYLVVNLSAYVDGNAAVFFVVLLEGKRQK